MLRRRGVAAVAMTTTASATAALQQPCRASHLPGWKTMTSTRDARSRAQREADRKARQLEKLPRPLALHDFPYPYEKTVLSDYMFQYPVYESELDTPHLFQLTPPPGFFVYWNVSQFDRTDYPAVPAHDHRLLVPTPLACSATRTQDGSNSSSNNNRHSNNNNDVTSDKSGGEEAEALTWAAHCARARQYLRKHEVCPNYIPSMRGDVNLSVVFAGKRKRHDRLSDEDDGKSSSSTRDAVRSLERDNFWRTMHYGNYMELADMQAPPSLFLIEGDDDGSSNNSSNGDNDAVTSTGERAQHYYTLLLFSPDYPCRVPSYDDRARADRGFLLTYMVANLRSQTPRYVVSRAHANNSNNNNNDDNHNNNVNDNNNDDVNDRTCTAVASEVQPVTGDVVVPYIPPLPTEDAGAARYIAVLYRQAAHVSAATTAAAAAAAAGGDALQCMSLAARSHFRLHDVARTHGSHVSADARHDTPSAHTAMSPHCLAALHAVEAALLPAASAVTFCHTTWDIAVQEFYERHGLPEPAAPVDAEVEATLEFHARASHALRVRARHRPDGSTNMGTDLNFAMQSSPTRITDGSMQTLWSRRTAMGTNGVPVIYPRPPDTHTPTLPTPPTS